MQVNHLGTSLLSLLLLPNLISTAIKAGSPSRLTIVSSEVHFWTPFNEKNAPSILARLDEKDSFNKSGIDRYNVSKLLNVLWTRELASRVKKDMVTINCLNPGLCATSLHRTTKGLGVFLINSVAFSSVQGAHIVTDAAICHADEHGAYLSEQRSTRCVPCYLLSLLPKRRIRWTDDAKALQNSCCRKKAKRRRRGYGMRRLMNLRGT